MSDDTILKNVAFGIENTNIKISSVKLPENVTPTITNRDFVIATGQTHSLEEFVEEAFNQLGLNWRNHVEINNTLMRPTDIAISKADPSKAMQKLNWKAKYKMREVVQMMIEPL